MVRKSLSLGNIFYVVFSGTFFTSWMECKIKEEYMKNPRKRYPDVIITSNCPGWSSITTDCTDFFLSKRVKYVTIYTHLIVLRGKEKKSLPLLSQYAGEHQGLFFFKLKFSKNNFNYFSFTFM
jgi:hypothetical protein